MFLIITLSLIVYLILVVILTINITEKSKIIKYSFLILLFFLLLMLLFSNDIVSDYIFSMFIRYLYYPTFSSVLFTIIVTMIIMLFNIFNDGISLKVRIMNYCFSSYILIAYIGYMLLNIDINSYIKLYSEESLSFLRYISRTFVIWMIANFTVKYYRFFLRKGVVK